MRKLPTEEGSVIGWVFYYDGPNYVSAVLTYEIIWDYGPDGEEDPDYPLYEGIVWKTSQGKTLSPDQMKKEMKGEYPFSPRKWVSLGRIPYERATTH